MILQAIISVRPANTSKIAPTIAASIIHGRNTTNSVEKISLILAPMPSIAIIHPIERIRDIIVAAVYQ